VCVGRRVACLAAAAAAVETKLWQLCNVCGLNCSKPVLMCDGCLPCLQVPACLQAASDEPLVMCVDDDEVNHIVLEGMLQSQGYRCVCRVLALLLCCCCSCEAPPNTYGSL
jgi:hypothetical protein